MIEILILLAAVAVLVFWWRRRRSRPTLPVDESYACPVCDETDCLCQKEPDKETRNSP